MTHSNAQAIGPIQGWRNKAKNYLEARKGLAPQEKLQSELDKSNNRIAELERQIAALVEGCIATARVT